VCLNAAMQTGRRWLNLKSATVPAANACCASGLLHSPSPRAARCISSESTVTRPRGRLRRRRHANSRPFGFATMKAASACTFVELRSKNMRAIARLSALRLNSRISQPRLGASGASDTTSIWVLTCQHSSTPKWFRCATCLRVCWQHSAVPPAEPGPSLVLSELPPWVGGATFYSFALEQCCSRGLAALMPPRVGGAAVPVGWPRSCSRGLAAQLSPRVGRAAVPEGCRRAAVPVGWPRRCPRGLAAQLPPPPATRHENILEC
jgi:hypothetical protein